MTNHADRRFVGRRRTLHIYEPTDVERLHAATLEVLTETGVAFHSPHALDVLEEHGATVNRTTSVARLPETTVAAALDSLPRTITLAGRDPQFDLPLDGEHAYLAADGCAPFVRDSNGQVRPSNKADVSAAARVVDALDNLSATSAIVSALDTATQTRVLHEFDACVRSSAKHTIVVSMKDVAEAKPLLRMAEALVGGRDELKRRPIFSVILGTVAPLSQERFGMDLAFTLAAAGIPIFIYPMPILGATAPATPAGAQVVANAEMLAAVTAIQLAHPGAPLIYAGGPAALDMQSGRYAANLPEVILVRAAQAHMARFYGLPAGLGWGGTKAQEPGAQAGYENAAGLLLEFLAGGELLFGAGLLDSVQQLSLEELVLADEMFAMVTRLLRGITVTKETLAGDVIARVGHSGEYLFDPHTRVHARELWRARLETGGSYEQWQAAGSHEQASLAAQRVREILAAPAPAFPDDLDEELTVIIGAAHDGAFLEKDR
ncbi:MAG: trimethylamine methyltransferase family protein [Thermoleophilia bacterium]